MLVNVSIDRAFINILAVACILSTNSIRKLIFISCVDLAYFPKIKCRVMFQVQK